MSSSIATPSPITRSSTTCITQSCVSISGTSSSKCLEQAKQLAVEAVNQDTRKDYKAAAQCYREAIELFRTFLGQQHRLHLEKHPRIKSGIKEKIILCSERLRILDRYLLERTDLSPLFQEVVLSQLPAPLPKSDEATPENEYEVIETLRESKPSGIMKEYVGSSISITGSTHSLYPRCEIKRATSIMSGASDFGLGEEIEENHSNKTMEGMTPPLADLKNELQISLSSLSSDEGITTTMRRKKPSSRLPESDADAILVLDEDDDEVRLLETSFEEEKDDEVAYVRADRIRSTNQRYKVYGDNASDSGISEERTVISSSDSGRSSSRNKSPISDCVDGSIKRGGGGGEGLSYSSLSGSTYDLVQQEILLAETQQPTRERYEYVPPRAFARNNRDKEPGGCFYLMACLDAFGVL